MNLNNTFKIYDVRIYIKTPTLHKNAYYFIEVAVLINFITLIK